MNKEAIVRELQQKYWFGNDALNALSSALDHYAFSIVEQSVPAEALIEPRFIGAEADRAYTIGFNKCRTAVTSKARELTNQPLKQEK